MFDGIQFIGTQRSGSNLLRLMLNQHPKISAHHPPHLLHTFYPLLNSYGDIGVLDNRRILVQDMCDWVLANPVTWEPVKFDVDHITGNCNDIVEIFDFIYSAKCVSDNAEIWACKSTHNTSFLHELADKLNLFYIYLYRDGRDVALSFKKAIVGPKHIYSIACKWNEDQIAALEFTKSIPAENYMAISYEKLLEQPEEVLTEMCRKLGVEYFPGMLKYYSSRESQLTSDAGRMWKNVAKPILVNNKQKYLSQMTETDLNVFESVARESLMELGYELQTEADVSFSEKQITEFTEADAELRKQASSRADQVDLERRKPQQNLIREILNRGEAAFLEVKKS